MYFPRMLDKIRLHGRGELHEDYHENLGAPRTLDGACCNFLRVNYDDLRERTRQGGTDEEILDWCFQSGRQPNEADLFVWNGFVSKLGWRDSFSPRLEQRKRSSASLITLTFSQWPTLSISMKADFQRQPRPCDTIERDVPTDHFRPRRLALHRRLHCVRI